MKINISNITINGGGFWNSTLAFLVIGNSTSSEKINTIEKDCGFRIIRKVA